MTQYVAKDILDMSSMYVSIWLVGPQTQMQQPLTANKFGEKTSTCYTCEVSSIQLLSYCESISEGTITRGPGPCFDPNLHNDRGGRSAGACRPAERHNAREERGRASEVWTRNGSGPSVPRSSAAAPALNYEEPPSRGAKCMF